MRQGLKLPTEFLVFIECFRRVVEGYSFHSVVYLPAAQFAYISDHIVLVIVLCSFNTQVKCHFLLVPLMVWIITIFTAHYASLIIFNRYFSVISVLPFWILCWWMLKWCHHILEAERIVNICWYYQNAWPIIVLNYLIITSFHWSLNPCSICQLPISLKFPQM